MTAEYNRIIKQMKSESIIKWFVARIENTRCRIVIDFKSKKSSKVDNEYLEYREWCKENCKGDHYVYNENYIFFELSEEAKAFKLRWL